MCLVPNHCPPSSFHLPLLTGLCLTSHDHVGHHLALLVLRDKLPDLLLTGEVQGKYLLKRRVEVHLDVAALHGVDVAHLREGEGQGRGGERRGGEGRGGKGRGGEGRGRVVITSGQRCMCTHTHPPNTQKWISAILWHMLLD